MKTIWFTIPNDVFSRTIPAERKRDIVQEYLHADSSTVIDSIINKVFETLNYYLAYQFIRK